MKKKCRRCEKFFNPAKKYYQYCENCYGDVAPMGRTTYRARPGGAARIHGGISKTTDGRRSLALMESTTGEVLRGLQAFLKDLYRHPMSVSKILKNAGLNEEDIDFLRVEKQLGNFVSRFCPKFWEWLGPTVGKRAREIIIDFYGLYGGERKDAYSIARNMGMTMGHVNAARGKALKNIREANKLSEFEKIVISAAQSVLTSFRK